MQISIESVRSRSVTLPDGTSFEGDVSISGYQSSIERPAPDPDPGPDPIPATDGDGDESANGSLSLDSDGSISDLSGDADLPEHIAQVPTDCARCGTGWVYGDAQGFRFDGSRAMYQCPRCNAWERGPAP